MAGFLTRGPVVVWLLLTLGACTALNGCGEEPVAPAQDGFERVTIDGETFTLELAADGAKRERGLSGRETIPADGGMLFVFPLPRVQRFWMKDCLAPIDIIYLDAAGRVVATYHMPVEPPKGEDENQGAYEGRLPGYSSRFPSQYVIELAGGTLEGLEVSEGDKIDLDLDRLRKLAK